MQRNWPKFVNLKTFFSHKFPFYILKLIFIAKRQLINDVIQPTPLYYLPPPLTCKIFFLLPHRRSRYLEQDKKEQKRKKWVQTANMAVGRTTETAS